MSATRSPGGEDRPRFARRLQRALFGPPRDLGDTNLFRHISVVAFLAWVGLGADGISSSAYGPEEAFRALGEHRYLALVIAGLMVLTVFVISACYSRIIERFPEGGGGYVVATALLGPRAGLVSGSALLVDYVLTIAISIAAAGDALSSFLPAAWAPGKLPGEVLVLLALTTLNIRGVRESILAMLPVFLLFLATHAVLVVGGILAHAGDIPSTAREVAAGFRTGVSTLGAGGMALLVLYAYSLGGGTYTGIEAVSNGLPIMREPRVRTARRTMLYMAASLAATAGGLVVCYLLWHVVTEPGKTLNAVLAERVGAQFRLGSPFVVLTLLSEGALLVVAAQAGFIDGPRVLANMASDGWAPKRFASLSERLTTRNGIVLMGLAALVALVATGGDVRAIVIMYSINVFLTFTLSMLGMTRVTWASREPRRFRRLALFLVGLVLCSLVLVVTVVEKIGEGGWVTLVVTGGVVLAFAGIRRHYRAIERRLAGLYTGLLALPEGPPRRRTALDPARPTAAILVGGYSGIGVRTVLAALQEFPNAFDNLVFVSAGVVDSVALRNAESLNRLRERTGKAVDQYLALADRLGYPAVGRWAVGTDVVEVVEGLCLSVASEFPSATFFAGQLVFQSPGWLTALLHNETAFAIQRRLQAAGRTVVILPALVD